MSQHNVTLRYSFTNTVKFDLVLCFISFFLISLFLSVNSFASSGGQGGPSFESGYVTARALVRGANGFPIFVEYDEEGEVVNIIGEAANDLQDAELMSASEQASEGQVLFLAQETRPDPHLLAHLLTSIRHLADRWRLRR